MNKHHSVFEFSQITETIYLGTNLCCLIRPHIQILLDLGINAEIDLERERQDTAPDVDTYMWLPIADKTAPNEDQLIAGITLIDEMVKRKKKVYVHCQLGHGRSPTLVAAYFISKGKTAQEAVDFVKVKRPEIHLEEVQISALENYYQTINK